MVSRHNRNVRFYQFCILSTCLKWMGKKIRFCKILSKVHFMRSLKQLTFKIVRINSRLYGECSVFFLVLNLFLYWQYVCSPYKNNNNDIKLALRLSHWRPIRTDRLGSQQSGNAFHN